VIRDVRGIHLRDITRNGVCVVRVVCTVSFLSVLVPLGREDALSPDGFKATPYPADPSEQINEPEPTTILKWLAHRRAAEQAYGGI